MEANELRIGNLVWDKIFLYSICEIGEILKAEVIDVHNFERALNEDFYETGSIYSLNYENVEPIPLTEEWLLKFGFESGKNRTKWLYYKDNKRLICHRLIHIKISGSKYNLGYIKYVHQLQNLYFALTGEELTQV
jgi:hypothetical protein